MAGRNGVAGKGVQSGNHRRYVPTSHESISHDSLANLGQDWSLVADPGMGPRPQFQVSHGPMSFGGLPTPSNWNARSGRSLFSPF